MRSEELCLESYDALMEQYDPCNRVADITAVFTDLKAFLKDFLPEALAVQQERLAKNLKLPLSSFYPIERQRELRLVMMVAVGFDLTRGSFSVSHHPFFGGVSSDVRVTTRYKTSNVLSALMGVLHETGMRFTSRTCLRPGRTALWARCAEWPCMKARACSSKSSSAVTQLSGNGRCRWSMDEILPHVHNVERGLIRVDADDVTYPLHLILRYELEQELIFGRLQVSDLPEAWDAQMSDYLGLSTIENPAGGPMQDVHWPSAAFGYFPSYTLGAMMAAQQWMALTKAHPSVVDEISRGHFEMVNNWRGDKIWSPASRWSTRDLLERATGEKLNAAHFTTHLKKRYDR